MAKTLTLWNMGQQSEGLVDRGRGMSIFTRVIDRLTKRYRVQQEPPIVPAGLIPPTQSRLDEFAKSLGISSGRTARYDDFETMDHGDIAAMLDAVCDAALTFEETDGLGRTELDRPQAFKILVEDDNHRAVIGQILSNTRLKEKLWQYTRDGLKYGDLFIELLAGYQNVLVGLQSYNPRSIEIKTDNHNRLLTGIDPDSKQPLPYLQVGTYGNVTTGWAPWEMLHWRWVPSDRFAYSEKSLLDDFRPDWIKLNKMELAMVVARVVRAYPRQVHYLDYTGLPETETRLALKDYMTRTSMNLRSRAGKTVAPDEDIFMTTGYLRDETGKLTPKLNKIETIDPRANGLTEISDIEYTRRKLFSRVPPEIIGISSNNVKDISSQDIAFGRLIRVVQTRLESLVREVLDVGLLLEGYETGSVNYAVLWPRMMVGTNWKLADAMFRTSMALRNYGEMGASRRWIFRTAWNMSSEEIDAMFEESDEELKRFGPFDPGTSLAKAKAGNNSSESGAPKFA